MSISFSIQNSPVRVFKLRDRYSFIQPGDPDWDETMEEDEWPETNMTNSNGLNFLTLLGVKNPDYCGIIYPDEMEPLRSKALILALDSESEYIRCKAIQFMEMFAVALATNNPITWG